jgi:phenylalanyl-tRNA synthetase alpha chain
VDHNLAPLTGLSLMTIDEKVRKTLDGLGVTDARGVQTLFAEFRALLDAERVKLIEQGASDDPEFNLRAKALRDRVLSRKNGLITSIDEHWLKTAPKELKPIVGREFNSLRIWAQGFEVEEIIRSVSTVKEAGTELAELTAERERITDLSLPGYRRPLGSIHPLTRVQRELEEIFLDLGYRIETGPEVETVYYNFEALNIPETHPARDDMDSLYVDADTVLRTHTSPVQIRAMQKYGAPLSLIVPGRVYRRDNPDATHSPMFHQIEGLAVDTDITFADLKGTLDFFAKKFFGEKIRTSFFPSFFPFTEPSGDLAISCVFCDGQGCRICKESGWIEVMGCGMVHPQVLRNGGIDPRRYCGWAFGLGIDRFAILKYGVNDIQLFFQNDVRFLEQF